MSSGWLIGFCTLSLLFPKWIPIWYEMKALFVAWLVLPQFRGAAFIYSKFVREQLRKIGGHNKTMASPLSTSPSKMKNKFMGLVSPKKGEQEAY